MRKLQRCYNDKKLLYRMFLWLFKRNQKKIVNNRILFQKLGVNGRQDEFVQNINCFEGRDYFLKQKRFGFVGLF